MSSKSRTAVKRKKSPSPSPPQKKTTKLDTEFGVQQHQRAMMKQKHNKSLNLYMNPRSAGITFHKYPDDGPNGYFPTYLADFNREKYKKPMEFAEMEKDGLTFGGRSRSRRRLKNKRKQRSRTRKSSS